MTGVECDAVSDDDELAGAFFHALGHVEVRIYDFRSGLNAHGAVVVRAQIDDVFGLRHRHPHQRIVRRVLILVTEGHRLRHAVELRAGNLYVLPGVSDLLTDAIEGAHDEFDLPLEVYSTTEPPNSASWPVASSSGIPLTEPTVENDEPLKRYIVPLTP